MPWVKGQSGNPGGRPRVVSGVRRRAQNVSDEMLDVLLDVARSSKASGKDRVTAAVRVLQVAGVPMTEDRTPPGDNGKKDPRPAADTEGLLQAATTTEGSA